MVSLLDQLNQDHGNVSRLLDAMDYQHRCLERGESYDPTLLARIMRYLTQYQDVYHHPRENLMFGCIMARSPGSVAQIEVIESEHETLGRQGQALHEAANESRADAPHTSLVMLLGDYTEALRQHMQTESTTIFPLARIILSHQDWDDLDARFEVAVDPLFGPQVEHAYRIVLESLGQDRPPLASH